MSLGLNWSPYFSCKKINTRQLTYLFIFLPVSSWKIKTKLTKFKKNTLKTVDLRLGPRPTHTFFKKIPLNLVRIRRGEQLPIKHVRKIGTAPNPRKAHRGSIRVYGNKTNKATKNQHCKNSLKPLICKAHLRTREILNT